jgi:hypothetical protein
MGATVSNKGTADSVARRVNNARGANVIYRKCIKSNSKVYEQVLKKRVLEAVCFYTY